MTDERNNKIIPIRSLEGVSLEINTQVRRFFEKYARSPVNITVGIEEYMELIRDVERQTGSKFHFSSANYLTLNGLQIVPRIRPGIDLGVDSELASVIYAREYNRPVDITPPPSGAV